MKKNAPALLAYLLLAGLGLLFALKSHSMGFWVDGVAGAGLLPLFTALAMLLTLVLSWREPDEPSADAAEAPSSTTEPWMAIGGLLVYAITLPLLGFALGTAILIALWARILYGKAWLPSIALSVVCVGAAILLFHAALGVPFPLKPMGL